MNLVRKDELSGDEASRIHPVPGGPENLITANGPTQADKQVSVRLGSCNSSATALVLEDSPSVLSLGRLVEEGFTFEWRAGREPVLVSPSGESVPMEVRDRVPMIAAPAMTSSAASDGSDGARREPVQSPPSTTSSDSDSSGSLRFP